MESPDLCDASSQLQEKYKHLHSQTMAAIKVGSSPEKVLVAAGEAIQELMTTNAELHEEIVDLKYDIESNDGYTRGLRIDHKALQAEYNGVLDKLKSVKANLETVQARLEVAEAQLQNLHPEEEASDEWAFAALGQETKLRLGLEKEVKQLKADRDRKEPLVKIGIDVRLRFLEQAKEHVPSQKRVRVEREVLELGNRAAHGGCGEADGSLFALGVVPAASVKDLIGIYKDLYHSDPSTFKLGSPQLREVINHKVTIRTLKALNLGLDRPILERQRTMEHIDIVMNKCAKLKDEVSVAGDTDILRRVALVREETTKIVELDRQSQSQPLLTKENRRPNTSY